MQDTVTIAHLTDVHLGPIAGFVPRYWTLKRALGLANWLKGRQRAHQRGLLDRLSADLLAQRPDHIAVTGDLTNLGLPWEHDQALAWLSGLGDPGFVSAIPGNHDIYSHIGRDPGTRRWDAYMRSDAEGAALAPPEWHFPYVRFIGKVALIGLNSAVPTPPFVAAGILGDLQRARLETLLLDLGSRGFFRLVLIHHPPLAGQTSPVRALSDALELGALIGRAGAELVIHGHNHKASLAWAGRVPVVGGASGSLAMVHKHETLGRYNLYTISGRPWRIEVVARGLAEEGGPIVQLARQSLAHVPPATVA